MGKIQVSCCVCDSPIGYAYPTFGSKVTSSYSKKCPICKNWINVKYNGEGIVVKKI